MDLLNRLRSIGSRLRLLCRKPRLMLLRKQLTPTLHKPLSVWLVPVLFLTALRSEQAPLDRFKTALTVQKTETDAAAQTTHTDLTQTPVSVARTSVIPDGT